MQEHLERTHAPDKTAWQIYRDWLGRDDREHFRQVYLGHYESRAAFGQHLLEDLYAASKGLAHLPSTLRPYIKLDGDLVVHHWETAGHFIVVPDQATEDSPGVLVFDAHGIGTRRDSLRTSQ